jgi:hypothetical protein
LTPSQARGLLTRAQIRAPFDGEIISSKTWLSNTIDNLKAKIGNVKAKIQEEEDPGPRSRPSLARHPVPDQLGASTTSSLQEGPPPTNLRLARQVSVPRELPLTQAGAWTTARSASPGCGRVHHDAWGTDSPRHATTPAGGRRKQLAPTGALMRVCSAAQPSHRHHLQLCRTQASPEALEHPLRRAPAYG